MTTLLLSELNKKVERNGDFFNSVTFIADLNHLFRFKYLYSRLNNFFRSLL